jgi:hypothetical protein
MKTFRSILFIAACLVPSLAATEARADGCYICSSGSTPNCKDYCRYSGQDTFAARKACEQRGCKIGGTASCPTAVNYKVCMAPPAQHNDKSADQTVALMCVAPAQQKRS